MVVYEKRCSAVSISSQKPKKYTQLECAEREFGTSGKYYKTFSPVTPNNYYEGPSSDQESDHISKTAQYSPLNYPSLASSTPTGMLACRTFV